MSEHFRRIALAPDQLVDLDDARGTVIRVARGRVWLTQHGDLADHVLDAGDAWAIERNGRTIVQAQESTLVDLSGPGAATAILPLASPVPARTFSEWIARAANGWISAGQRPYY